MESQRDSENITCTVKHYCPQFRPLIRRRRRLVRGCDVENVIQYDLRDLQLNSGDKDGKKCSNHVQLRCRIGMTCDKLDVEYHIDKRVHLKRFCFLSLNATEPRCIVR
ncbi:hypothetical protein V1478_002123 [Vespula squamosa]|uniref:Uncharacterized protein n=1 Tax=Vespula squamosa TaxID=30214 RepID=A0ABD2BZ36_VESSQ